MTAEFTRGAWDGVRLAMLAALTSGDVALAFSLSTELLADGVPFDEIVVDVFGPVQAEIGRRWADGDLSVADEHAASATLEELVTRLGRTVEVPSGPTVVVASAEHDDHALGARIVAISLSLEGFRVLFLGGSVPAEDLRDCLEQRRPLALALSCSMSSALVGAASCIAAAHAVNVPVVGGGRALANEQRAVRLGVDALAPVPRAAVERLHAWSVTRPPDLATGARPVAERRQFATRTHSLIATALDASGRAAAAGDDLAHELARMLQVVEAALMLEEPALVDEQVEWLRATGFGHGVPRGAVDDALAALGAAMDGDLQRAGDALVAALV